MYYDELTLERIQEAHPNLREQLKQDYLECNNTKLGKGIRLRFADVFRSKEEQAKLYAQGRTKPGKIVTNADAGESIHNYGLAFDIVLLYDLDGNGTFETASWERNSDWNKVVQFFKSKGYEWGGDWRSIKDYPHFQETFGYSWLELIEMKSYDGYPCI